MKTRIINLFGIGLVSALALTSCSDEFLEDKKSYDKVSGDLYNTYEGCELRIDDIYSWCLPTTNSKANWRYPSSGQKDDMSQSTEEYPGFSLFVDPETELTTMQGNAPDYFYGSFGNIQANTYGHIRLINDAIQGISASNGITDAEKDKLLGQAYFFRVLSRASRRLLRMSSGRYELVPSSLQKGNARSVLDLDVIDHYTGRRRPTKGLSGGEAFLASLSLALGLSDDIQMENGGARMEAMFIDEGFGSLDSETLRTVMSVLSDLGNGDRLIGIISHVEALKESIPRGAEVIPDGRGGSRLRLFPHS